MIVGIGTDLIEMNRVVKACEKASFLRRCFTDKEKILIEQNRTKAAGNFAVKEAVVKMFGTGFREITPNEIECLRDELGKPYVNLYGEALHLKEKMGIKTIHVSISNTKEYAVAFAVGED